MLVTSHLPIQTTKIFYSFFDVHLCPPALEKVPPPMTPPISRSCANPDSANLPFRPESGLKIHVGFGFVNSGSGRVQVLK